MDQMNVDTGMFNVTMVLVAIAWLGLLFAPAKRLCNWWLAGVIIPFLISLMFAYLLPTSWKQPPGQSFFVTAATRFLTFGGVYNMLKIPGLLDATWLDNLTTGMLFGAWMTRRAQRTRLARPLLVICQLLVATASPLGVMTYFVIEGNRGNMSGPAAVTD